MTEHDDPQDCIPYVEYGDGWEEISLGAYRYGSCCECGRVFREYFSYVQLEAVDGGDEGDGDGFMVVSRR